MNTTVHHQRHASVSLNEQPIVHNLHASVNEQLATKQNKERFYHLMVPYKNSVVIYGGQSSDGGLASRAYRPVHCEIFLYDFKTNKLEEVQVKNLNRVDTSRRNHCGAMLGDWLIVYGGLNTCVNYLDDLQAFNFLKLEWTKLRTVGTKRPPGLCRAQMQVVFFRQRNEQLIKDLNNLPPMDWAKVE